MMTVIFAGALFFLLAVPTVRANDFYVTSVIRDFPMTSGEKPVVDYYINAGSSNGLRKGLTVDAIRKMQINDNVNSKLAGDTQVHIARMKLIHVDKNVSIARLLKMADKNETPVIGYNSVMIGDLIEVSEKQ